MNVKMILSEPIPPKVCDIIKKLIGTDQPTEEEEKKIIGKLDRKWDVLILGCASYTPGIFTSVLVLEEAFPRENPLAIQLTEENMFLLGDEKRYVIYSQYIESIDTVLPVGCSVIDRTLLAHHSEYASGSNAELNMFLHYVNAKESILEQFKKDLIRMMNREDFYLDIANMDQKILQVNTLTDLEKKEGTKKKKVIISDWYRDHIIKRYWKEIFESTRNRKMRSWIHRLKQGRELTHNMCYYLLEDTEFKNYCIENKHNDDVMSMKSSLEKMISEYSPHGYRKRSHSNSVDFFFCALNNYVKSGYRKDYYQNLINFLK
jgi:hypothetical protein